jgi:hypothetical protein
MTGEQKRAFHAQLLWVAYEKGYKPGWAAYKFMEKFHHWPSGKPEPMKPEPAVLSWIRARQIAYAKARQAAE